MMERIVDFFEKNDNIVSNFCSTKFTIDISFRRVLVVLATFLLFLLVETSFKGIVRTTKKKKKAVK